MKYYILIFYTFLISGFIVPAFSQENEVLSPIERSGFQKVTSYNEVVEFVNKLSASYPDIKVDIIGKSVKNRKIQKVDQAKTERRPALLGG